jgi:hypothetical protein
MWDMKNLCIYLREKAEGKRPLGRPKHRWDILDWILKKLLRRVCIGFIWLKILTSGWLLRKSNEHSGTIKCGKFFD